MHRNKRASIAYFADFMSFSQELYKYAFKDVLVFGDAELRPDRLGNSRHVRRDKHRQQVGQIDRNVGYSPSTNAATTTKRLINYLNRIDSQCQRSLR